jgi:hypothetical protein
MYVCVCMSQGYVIDCTLVGLRESMYVCMHVCVCMSQGYIIVAPSLGCGRVCMYLYVWIHLCVYVFVCMYMYVCLVGTQNTDGLP